MEFRNENKSDYRQVEELTREAFWNLYVPGCDEHYFLHELRMSENFIPELDLVAIEEGRIVAHIAYMESVIGMPNGSSFRTITFGPVSVLPELQNKGIGSQLIRYSVDKARLLGYKAIVIFGYPDYYSRFDFVNAKEYGVSDTESKYPYAMQILELEKGALKGVSGQFNFLFNYSPTAEAIEAFDKLFSPKEKFETESQKKFAKTLALFYES